MYVLEPLHVVTYCSIRFGLAAYAYNYTNVLRDNPILFFRYIRFYFLDIQNGSTC